MDTFLSQHQDVVTGTLSTFDWIIFKGHLLQFFPKGTFARFLSYSIYGFAQERVK